LSAGNDRGEGFAGLSGRKVDRWMISDLYRLTWDVTDRTDLYVQLYHASLNYQGDLPLYDQRSVQGTLGFEFHPFAKTYFFGETYYGQTENDRNVNTIQEYPTVNFVGMFLGARGQFTERLHGTAKAGFEHRFYAGRGDSLDSPVVEISLDEQLSERTLLTLGYSRRQYESIQLVQSAYSMDSIAMTWQQQIGSDGRLKSLLRASYLRSVFDKTAVLVNGREDNLLSASLTLAYDIKLWLRAFGSYNFEHLHSSERSIVNYYVNRVTLGLQLGY
jgi:hypothetical protein